MEHAVNESVAAIAAVLLVVIALGMSVILVVSLGVGLIERVMWWRHQRHQRRGNK